MNSELENIQKHLNNLIEKVVVDFDRRQQWLNPIRFKLLPQNEYDDGTIKWQFAVRSSFWRLETSTHVLCGCLDEAAKIDSELNQLLGKQLKFVEVKDYTYSLTLEFDGGLYLHTIPMTSQKASYWSITILNEKLMVGYNRKWKVTER